MYLVLYHKKRQLRGASVLTVQHTRFTVLFIFIFLFDSKQFPSVMYSILVYNGEVRVSVYFETRAHN